MSGHTPTPWRLGAPDGQTGPTTPSFKPFCGGKDWPYSQITRGLDTVAILPAPDDGDSFRCGEPLPAQAEANAALIVKAVNAHDVLIEALEATPLRGRNEDPRAFDDRQTAWLRDHFRPALALARGEQESR